MTLLEIAETTTLEERLQTGIDRARELQRRVMVSVAGQIASVDSLAFFAAGRRLGQNSILWERPDAERALVGVGAAHEIEVMGVEAASSASVAWKQLLTGAEVEVSGWCTGPLLLGGFAFSSVESSPLWQDFPAGVLTLPRYTLSTRGEETWLTTTVLVGPEDSAQAVLAYLHEERSWLLAESLKALDTASDPADIETHETLPACQWEAAVREVADTVRSSSLEKVVLARSVGAVIRDGQGDPSLQALQRLRKVYPGCTVFAVGRGNSCFLGATPERLVSLRAGEVRASSLAGSCPRGETEQEDARLGTDLLASPKERTEHEVVARMLVDTLRENCDEVRAPSTPQLLHLHNVQHLYTPITARARRGQSVLHLVERLHPTPAVGGSPRAAALELIQQHERLARGWYAGPVGWMNSTGEGEFVVGIRSALVRGNEAVLYAGCGIVGDSDPASEYQESQLKLRPMLAALGGSWE